MSQLLFEFHSVIEYPAYSLSKDQHEPLLKEEPITVTARTEREAKNRVFEDCLKDRIRLVHLEITDKRETK